MALPLCHLAWAEPFLPFFSLPTSIRKETTYSAFIGCMVPKQQTEKVMIFYDEGDNS